MPQFPDALEVDRWSLRSCKLCQDEPSKFCSTCGGVACAEHYPDTRVELSYVERVERHAVHLAPGPHPVFGPGQWAPAVERRLERQLTEFPATECTHCQDFREQLKDALTDRAAWQEIESTNREWLDHAWPEWRDGTAEAEDPEHLGWREELQEAINALPILDRSIADLSRELRLACNPRD